MLTINTINAGTSKSDGINGSMLIGWNEATYDTIPLHPDEVSVAVASEEINTTIAVMPYPILHTVAKTEDQNPIRLTDPGMIPAEANESCPLPILRLA